MALRQETTQAQQLIERGFGYFENKEYSKALETYNEALLSAGTGKPLLSADIRYRMGRVYLKQQHYNQSLASFSDAYNFVNKADGDVRRDKAVLHNYIGIVYQTQGQFESARNEYSQELLIRRELGDQPGEFRALINLGATYLAQGLYARAMEFYENARQLDSTIKPRNLSNTGLVLTHIGSLYSELGQYEKAQEFHHRALEIYENDSDLSGVATAFHNLGYTQAEQSNFSLAIVFFRKAVALREELQDQFGRADTLNNLGLMLAEDGQTASALTMLEEALQILQELNARKQLAATLDSIGTVYKKESNYSQALDYYTQSLVLWRQLDDRDGERITMANVGSVLVLQDKIDAAIIFYKMSINITQEIRTELKFLPKKEQRAYATRIEKNYRKLADLLIDQGRLAEAEQVLTMLKEEEFFEFMRHRSDLVDAVGTVATLTETEKNGADRYAKISQELISIGQEFEKLSMRRKHGLSVDEKSRLEQLRKDIRLVREKFHAYVDEIEVLFDEQGGDRSKDFVKQDTSFLDEIQQDLKSLGSGVVLLNIFMTEDRLRLLLTAPDTSEISIHRDSEIAWKKLNHLIADFRNMLQNPHSDPSSQAKMLYDYIIGPIENDLLLAGARTLLLSLDDTLRYLPFAALHDGTRYLGERYGLAVYTAAARRHLTTPPQAEWRIAGLGVSEGAGGAFGELPAVRRELDNIIRDQEHDDQLGVLPGVIRLNDDFSPDQLSADLWAGYEVVHIASHFKFQPGSEADSFLLLGANQKLTLADIQDGDYPLTKVDLLTLSACETAYSEADSHGREIESFGVFAQKRGAKAVLATLWSVDDSSTAEFMVSFYQRRQQGMTKAEALRQTQLAFQRGEGHEPKVHERDSSEDRGAISVDSNEAGATSVAGKSYVHPYYWAPFILMGNSL